MKYLFLSLLIVFQCFMSIQTKPLINNVIQESDLTRIKDSVEHINQGGCAYFAMKLYEILDHKRYSLIKIGDYKHVVVKDNELNYYINSDGITTELAQSILTNSFDFQPISYDSVRYRVYNYKWNPKFNWKDTVKINNFINHLKYKNEKVTDSVSY